MAIDFNGTSSYIRHDTQDIAESSQVMTLCCWALSDNPGQNNGGTVFQHMFIGQPGRTSLACDGANRMRIRRFTSATTGLWRFPWTDGAWAPLSFTYDWSSAANNPVVRVNYASATVTLVSTPTGTLAEPTGGFFIGDNNSGTGAFNGGIQHLQLWNSLKTASAQDEANRHPGIVSGAILHISDYENGGCYDRSGNRYHPNSLQFVSFRDGPPIVPFPLGGVGPVGSAAETPQEGGGGQPTRMRLRQKAFARG